MNNLKEKLFKDFGLIIDEITADGKLYRVPVIGDKLNKKSGAYIVNKNFIFVQNFKTGIKEKILQNDSVKIDNFSSNSSYKTNKKLLENEYLKTAKILEDEFKNAKWAYSKNPYLVKKGFDENFYLKQDKMGNILIPLKDINNKFWNLQRIFQNGDKMFGKLLSKNEKEKQLSFKSKKTGCFYIIGSKSLNNLKDIIIVEGFSTGASLYKAINKPVIVAFDVGNIENVYLEIKKKYPNKNYIICSDNDHYKDINIGLKTALYLKDTYKLNYILPKFKENETLSDWNDLYLLKGLNEVKEQFFNSYIQVKKKVYKPKEKDINKAQELER